MAEWFRPAGPLYPIPMVRDEQVLICDPASYAARLRSADWYYAASVVENHLGERRQFGPSGEGLVQRIDWRVPDCRRCWDHSLERAYGDF